MYPKISLVENLEKLHEYSKAIQGLDISLTSLKKLPISKNEFINLIIAALSTGNQAEALKAINMAIGRYKPVGETTIDSIYQYYEQLKKQYPGSFVLAFPSQKETRNDHDENHPQASDKIPEWWKLVTLVFLTGNKPNKNPGEATVPDTIKRMLAQYVTDVSENRRDGSNWQKDIENIIGALIGVNSSESSKKTREELLSEITEIKETLIELSIKESKFLFEVWWQRHYKNETCGISDAMLEIIITTLKENDLCAIIRKYSEDLDNKQFNELLQGASRLQEVSIESRAKLKNAIIRSHKDWMLSKLNIQQGEPGKEVKRIHLVSYTDICLGFAVLNEAFSKTARDKDCTLVDWLSQISAKEVLELVDKDDISFVKARVALEIVWGLGNTSKKHADDNPHYCVTESEVIDLVSICRQGTTLVVDGHGASIGYWNSKSSQSAAEGITRLMTECDGKVDKVVVQQCLSGSLSVSETAPELIRKSNAPKYKHIGSAKDRLLFFTIPSANPFKQHGDESKKDAAKALGWCLWHEIKHSKDKRLPGLISITTTPALLNPKSRHFGSGNIGQPADHSFRWPDKGIFGENTTQLDQVKSITVFVSTSTLPEDARTEALKHHSKARDDSWNKNKSAPEPQQSTAHPLQNVDFS